MTTASSISPNWLKKSYNVPSVVWYGKPPTNSLVSVLSFCKRIGPSAIAAIVTLARESEEERERERERDEDSTDLQNQQKCA